MKNATMQVSCCFAVLLGVAAAGQDVPVILQVDTQDSVRYGEDVTDRSGIARSPVPVPATPALNFNRGIVIGDIIAVNGSPAKGATLNLVNDIRLTPNPGPGAAISDVNVPALAFAAFYFANPNGVPIGTIFAVGNVATGQSIVGGSGAFVG